MTKLVSTNPGKNYEVIGGVEVTPDTQITAKVKKANEAKASWKELGVKKRTDLLRNVYSAFKKRAEDIAVTISKEVGTPITEARDEVDWDWGYFEWFLDNADKFIAPEITHEDSKAVHKVLYEPIGSAAVITPWNLPLDLFFWGVIPNLLVGNTVVYKAAEECVLSGKLYEEIMGSAGLPSGAFSAIHGDSKQGKYLVDEEIDLIWFTGSSEVGKRLYEITAKKFIKAVLEMGGSNPAIVFEDADIDLLADKILSKRYAYCGQTCDAVKRLIVHEKIYNKIIDKLKKTVESLKVGDPDDPKTQMGPLVSERQLELLLSQVAEAKKKGAGVITGGKQPSGLKGAYYLPTILTNITTDMRVWQEEVFGPVLPVISFNTEDEAVQLANDTQYGLGSQIYSSDTVRAQRIAQKLHAGNVEINGQSHWQPFNPFGGYKKSGIGREHGKYGFHELCQIKIISQAK